PLTQLITQNTMLVRLREKIENSRHNGFPFAIMIINLAEFKHKNRLLDYEFDAIVRAVADFLKHDTRSGVDILSRTTEHEFLIAMPGATLKKAEELAQQFKRDISTNLKAPRDLTIAAQIGVAEYAAYAAVADNRNAGTVEMVEELIQLATINSLPAQQQLT
ncbi:MAG: diguanylate cyclase, partial [Methylococcales bacterium]